MCRAPTVLDEDLIRDFLNEDDLGLAGKTVLDGLGPQMTGINHVVVLGDAQGRILFSAGQRGIQARLDEMNFMPGALWAEDAVGPNGVGTPLALGAPDLIFGTEHFCKGWQPWVCYGHPVREPGSGRIVGVIDVTGPAIHARPEMLALTASIANMVEQQLLVFELKRQELLRHALRRMEDRWPNEGLVLVNNSGRIIDLNGRAVRLLEIGHGDAIHRACREVFPEPCKAKACRLIDGRLDSCPGGRLVESGCPGGLCCQVEPVLISGHRAGSVVVLSIQGARHPASAGLTQRNRPANAVHTARYHFPDLLGRDARFIKALELAKAAAQDPLDNPILITGETGTGKELVAHAIHGSSRWSNGPFVVVNCGALPRDLADSELFGYGPGAFTGARRDGLAGKFELASGGTLFLDEIDSLPLDLQPKFLRVLEDKEVTKLGCLRPVRVSVRVSAAASAGLQEKVKTGAFRLDLYHRLSVLDIVLPPLRERRDDIELLAMEYLWRACQETGRPLLKLSPAAIDCMVAYCWPGNVREIKNVCARLALTVNEAEVGVEHLPAPLREAMAQTSPVLPEDASLHEIKDAVIRQTILEAGGCISEAARRLGVARTTVYRRAKRSSDILVK
jgi:transcriptional regulator of acetoin/glycerol metabolism